MPNSVISVVHPNAKDEAMDHYYHPADAIGAIVTMMNLVCFYIEYK